ncbi:hypothetical protein QCA50_013866 [Cerrena zonata]|uniref:GATA-type domain-containing protein n=1 Tax=Cerrena zonata TaxID=2478898 RepID=A0AAW0FZV3_9APHY
MARASYYPVPHEPPASSASHLESYPDHPQSHAEPHQDVAGQDNQANYAHLRQCSVRGCTTTLAPEYPQKMCEACRGRHRVYASTKRRKRKMEKQAIGGQLGSVVWMPPNSDEREDQPQAGPSSQPTQAPEDREHSVPEYQLAASGWDNSAIDPSLFSQDHHSYSQSQHSTAENNTSYAQELSYPSPDAFAHHENAYFQDPHGHPFPQPSDPGSYSQNSNSYSQGPSPYTQHSELAGALQLPQHHAANHATSHPPYHPPQLLPDDPSVNELHGFPDDPSGSQSQNRAPAVPTGEISAKAISEVAAEIGGASLPHRYCSVKGCKAVVPGDSFFKMCEPCRNRYRSYGTTKRAKWKREKEAAVAELQKIREDDDERRATVGLPPLAEGEWSKPPPAYLLQAANSQTPPEIPFSNMQGGTAPRMCTVSHCREVLPPEYPFLRCERHRIQNRHHSKLKRVRDKESKAAAFHDWSAAAAANAHGSPPEDDEGSQSPYAEEEPEEEVRNLYDQVLPDSEGTGVPPAARGSRRTNHVCSIKACYNLLSPFNPWKMCDSCRDRDRAVRRNKALRDSGLEVEPLPPKPRTPPPEGQKKTKKKGGGKKLADKAQTQAQAQGPETQADDVPMEASIEQGATAGSTSPMVFMNPLAPPPDHHNVSFGIGNGLDTSLVNQATSSNATQSPVIATTDPSDDPTRPGHTPAKRKSSGTNEPVAAGLSTVNPVASTSSVPIPQPAPMSSVPAPATQPIQPAYPFTYYPMPHYMTPYHPGTRYPPYSTSPPVIGREGYAPSPVYQPPYTGYAPYAYPWSPWGPTPHFPTPMAMPAGTVTAPALQTSPQVVASALVPAASSSVMTSTSAVTTSNQASQDKAAMYSTFLSRPPGASNDSQNSTTAATFQASAPPPTGPPDPREVAFSVRPGGGSPSKRKRPVDQETTNKRQVAEPSNSNVGGASAGDLRQQPGPGISGISSVQNVQYTTGTPFPTSTDEPAGSHLGSSTPGSDGKRLTCTNKSCHRSLPSGATAAGLCEKCKERIRKKNDVVKRRAKLEPRNLVGSTFTGGRLEKIAVHGLHS